MSDTHGRYDTMRKILQKEKDCQVIIHAGDMLADIKQLKSDFPHYRYEYVIGNNDFTQAVPTEKIFELENIKVFLTHGHKFGVKRTLNNLFYKASETGADICIFGHTHIKYLERINEISILNPGFGGFGEYAIIETNQNEFNIKHKHI